MLKINWRDSLKQMSHIKRQESLLKLIIEGKAKEKNLRLYSLYQQRNNPIKHTVQSQSRVIHIKMGTLQSQPGQIM